MAEKEERIWLEFDIPKPKGAIEATRCTTMTRQEAIKKMSDAIATPYFEGVFSCENEAIEEYAKAALNALLEE